MVSSIRSLVQDVRHGLTLKFFAMISRIVFLFVVTPRLLSGQLSSYVFLATIAIFAGRLISLGMDEQLPLRVAGKKDTAVLFAPLIVMSVTAESALAALFVVWHDGVLVTMLLAFCYVTTNLFVGLVRSVNLEASERLRDLHWVIFTLLCLFPARWSAEELLALMAASLMSVHFLELRISGVDFRLNAVRWRALARETVAQLRRAWRKLLSSASVLLMVRAIILWPTIFAMPYNLDEIAYALLIGEAFLQTSMVLVYRQYARYCVTIGPADVVRRDLVSALLVLLGYAALVAIGVQMLNVADFQIGRFSNWTSVSVFVLFFGLISGYLLLRYLIWALVDFDWRLLGIEVIFVVTQGLVVYYLAMQNWIGAIAACALLLVGLTFAYVVTLLNAVSKTSRIGP